MAQLQIFFSVYYNVSYNYHDQKQDRASITKHEWISMPPLGFINGDDIIYNK